VYSASGLGLFAIGTQVNTVAVSSLTVNPIQVLAGTSSTGTITLSAAAPAGGDVVTLSSGNSAAAAPAFVIVASGSKTATFTITTTAVSTDTSALITATSGGVSATATLTVQAVGVTGLSLNPTSLTSGTSSIGTVTLNTSAPSGGTLVNLVSNSTSAVVPGTVTVATGATTATFTITTSGVATATTATITATVESVSASATLTIIPAVLTSVTMNPTSVAGGVSSTGTVTLNGPAPAGGDVVTLTSNTSSAVVPSSVTVASGATTATFTITTSSVATSTGATITASFGGASPTALLTITPAVLTGVSVSPTSVKGGTPSTGTVTLNGPAAPGGDVINLSSNSPSAVVPLSVTVASGATTATFTITTSVVAASTPATITATFGGASPTTTLTITPAVLTGVSVSPTTIIGGNSVTGTVTLDGPAPSGGDSVSLSSSNAAAVVPLSVTVASGATTANFTITTSAVSLATALTISAVFGGVTKTASLLVTFPNIVSVTASPNPVTGGASSIATITLSDPAATTGFGVTLSSSDNTKASVPNSFTFPPGASTATFTITTTAVASSTTATITAKHNPIDLASTVLTISPPVLTGVSLSPTTITGVGTSTGTVTLNGKAPFGGTLVTLTNQWPAYVTVPASVTVPAGSTSKTFTVSTPQMYQVSFTDQITATFGANSFNATLTVGTYALQSIALNPPSVQAGGSSTGTLTLGGPAPAAGWTITLTSANPTFVGVPATVTVPHGATTATFNVTTQIFAPTFSCLISAHDSVIYHSAILNVTTDAITGLSLNPATIGGNGSSTGTISLKSPAPAGGWTVSVSVGIPWLVTAPTSVTVPAGASSVTFPITAKETSATYTSGIYLTDGHSGANAVLTIVGDLITSLTLNPTTIGAGGTSTGTITLKTAAPLGGWVIHLTAGIPWLVSLPATVTVPAGATSATFAIVAKATGTAYTTGIYATDGNSAANANLTIASDLIQSISVNPTSVVGGTGSTGTVTLKSAAPPGGWLVQLSSAVPSMVGVPATVVIPAGQTSVTFAVITTRVSSTLNVGVYATDGNSGASTIITVTHS